MLRDYMTIGGTEIYNSARLRAYLETVGSPLSSAPEDVCGCPAFTAAHAGDAPYTTPGQDGAPWYDPAVPESAEFAGLLVLDVQGMDEHPVRRAVTTAVVGGAALGPRREQPRTITVTALLLGATCCAVEYGLHWLGQALEGCGDGGGCDGRDVTVYNCCPAEDLQPEAFDARHRRTLRRVALVEGPRVIARAGDGCSAGECSVGADILEVEWVMTAATPWLWTDPVPVLDVAVPTDDGGSCITWCLHGGPGPLPGACEGTCHLADCPDLTVGCADPYCQPPPPPVPVQPDTCFCRAVAVNEACYELDLTGQTSWSAHALMVTIGAGSSDLRRLTIAVYERTGEHDGLSCEEIAELERCDPHQVIEVGFVPAGGVLTLDGQIGRALVECGGVRESSTDVYGRDGSPVSWRLLDCRRSRYCLCITADALFLPALDATVEVAVTGRGY